MSGLCRGCHSRCGSRKTGTNCLKVFNRHFLVCESALSWRSAKTPGGGRPPRQECLSLTIHIATALHLLFSACTQDVTSTVMTRMHVRSSMRAHSPLSGSSVNESWDVLLLTEVFFRGAKVFSWMQKNLFLIFPRLKSRKQQWEHKQ